jgi:diguanylate cyclase (GGDEF)-like protein
MALKRPTVRHPVSLFVPGGVLLLAASAVQAEEVVRSAAAPYAVFLCYGACAAALLLSWYYDQSRLLCVASVVVLTVWIAERLPNVPHVAGLAAVFLLPLNFMLFGWIKERGVMSFEGFLAIGAVIAQAYGVVWIGGGNLRGAEAFLGWGERSLAVGWLSIPALLAFAIAGAVLLILFVIRRTTAEPGLLWALVAMFLGVNQTVQRDALLLYAGTAGLVLVFAVLEHGYDIAYRDELTELPGRRAFNHVMEQLGGTYTLAICDIDEFKKLNDTYGHETGDQILRMVAVKLSQVGGGGRAFRYGGEEFLIVFRGLSAKEAAPFVESVRQAVASAEFFLRAPDRPAMKPKEPVAKSPGTRTKIDISISAGVAGRSGRHSSPELVLDAADTALYRAKEAGRNCVKLAETTPA